MDMKDKFLKEDGSLDIERINKLPLEEYMHTMGCLTQEEIKEYLAKLPINESTEPYRGIWVDYTMEDELERGTAVDAMEYLNNWKKQMYKS